MLLTPLQTKTYSWLNIESDMLDEIVGTDGPGDRPLNQCSSCSNNQPVLPYRCIECSYSSLHCNECIVKLHKTLPLYRLEVGTFPDVQSCHTHAMISTGRMVSLTEPPFIHLDSHATLGMVVTPVPSGPHPTNS